MPFVRGHEKVTWPLTPLNTTQDLRSVQPCPLRSPDSLHDSACRTKASPSHVARLSGEQSGVAAMTCADPGYERLAERPISRCETHSGLCDRLKYALGQCPLFGMCGKDWGLQRGSSALQAGVICTPVSTRANDPLAAPAAGRHAPLASDASAVTSARARSRSGIAEVCPLPTRIVLSYLTLWAQRSRAPAWAAGDTRLYGAGRLQQRAGGATSIYGLPP
jgi:hypothetical protein